MSPVLEKGNFTSVIKTPKAGHSLSLLISDDRLSDEGTKLLARPHLRRGNFSVNHMMVGAGLSM